MTVVVAARPARGIVTTMNSTATTTSVKYNDRTWAVTTYVDPYPGRKGTDRIEQRDTCSRCGGTGIFVWWNAMGKCAGTCFLCLGARTVTYTRAVSTLRREAKVEAVWREHGDVIRAESAAKAREVEAAHAAAEFAEHWDAAHAEQERRAALVTGHAGNVGDKIDAVGTVDAATTFERDAFRGYGTDIVAMVVITLESGHVVKAVGTGESLYGVERGARVRVRGTVKAHGSYNGQDQTVLTRTKLSVPA